MPHAGDFEAKQGPVAFLGLAVLFVNRLQHTQHRLHAVLQLWLVTHDLLDKLLFVLVRLFCGRWRTFQRPWFHLGEYRNLCN